MARLYVAQTAPLPRMFPCRGSAPALSPHLPIDGRPATRNAFDTITGREPCHGHGHTLGVPGRAWRSQIGSALRRDDLGHACPGTHAEHRMRSLLPRMSAYGALLFVRLWHSSSSLPVALVRCGYRVTAGYALHRGCPAHGTVSSCCPAWRRSAVRRPPAGAGAYRPDPVGERPAPSW